MKTLLLPLLLLCAIANARAENLFLMPGVSIDHVDQTWHDATRNREVPVRIYFPKNVQNCPVVLFSHGLGGSREGYAVLGESWAAHSVVSVHLQHIGSDDSLWKDVPKGERLGRMRAGASPVNSMLRVGDMNFALDQLASVNTAPGPLQGKLDVNKVGIAGHSFGALTVQIVAGAQTILGRQAPDPRIKAVIAMSSPVPPGVSGYGLIKLPTFHLTGTEDLSPGTTAADRLIPYQQATFTPTYLMNYTGGTHMIFGGRNSTPDKYESSILALTNAFWQAHLRDDASARDWLKKGDDPLMTRVGKFESK